MPSSSVSTMGSPKSEDLHVGFNNSYQDDKQKSKKRKADSTWTEKLTVNSGTRSDAPPADGYNWRKYGQKDILGTKHPRSYYRCTYRSVHNCWATKQIQKSDEDPTMFHITYKGKHTCTVDSRSKSAPTSPGIQQAKPNDLLNTEYQQQQQDSAMSLSLENALIANTQNTDIFPFSWTEFGLLRGESSHFLPSTINNTDNFYRSFSPSLTPSTSGSNYFSMSPCTTDTFASLHHQEHNFEPDIAEMLSVTISGTESATIEQDFSADTWFVNPNLPANNQ
uniref:WRKY transcription factor n=1 Tax=Fagopyrum tataricum TaxID=62330 RepID=A0A4P9Q287_FAGTA|nr:WRKY transcription factor [Fagopyrum tataricum]